MSAVRLRVSDRQTCNRAALNIEGCSYDAGVLIVTGAELNVIAAGEVCCTTIRAW